MNLQINAATLSDIEPFFRSRYWVGYEVRRQYKKNGQNYKVVEVVYHDDFDFSYPDTIKSNLAMLKTAGLIQLGKNVREIAMEHKHIGDGVLATIRGWATVILNFISVKV